MKKLLLTISLVTLIGCSNDDDNNIVEERDFEYRDFLTQYTSIQREHTSIFFYNEVKLDDLSEEETNAFGIFLNESIDYCLKQTIEYNEEAAKVEEPALTFKNLPYELNVEDCY